MNNEIAEGRDNNQRLHRTMTSYGISRRWIAINLRVSLASVDRWLQPDGDVSYEAMPTGMLRLLEYAINDVTNGQLYRNPPDPEGELRPRP
jgi:hypothetical protein